MNKKLHITIWSRLGPAMSLVYQTSNHVLYKGNDSNQWKGPETVIRREKNRFQLSMEDNMCMCIHVKSIHVNQLRCISIFNYVHSHSEAEIGAVMQLKKNLSLTANVTI